MYSIYSKLTEHHFRIRHPKTKRRAGFRHVAFAMTFEKAMNKISQWRKEGKQQTYFVCIKYQVNCK